MTNFIPIFPLSLVVYPGEALNLHIFEPRYIQLIQECYEFKKPFGIPAVIDGKVNEMGSVVEVVEISEVHEGGAMDIKTKATATFKILEILKDIPEKLYSGAIVTYPPQTTLGSAPLMKNVLEGIRKMHRALQVQKDFKKPDSELLSYDVAHHAGMSLQDEYYLLELEQELHRQEFLKRQITKTLETIEQMDSLKAKIQLNGHFKNLQGFQF